MVHAPGMHRHGPLRRVALTALVALALLPACSSDDGDSASSTTAGGQGTVPPGPSLCTRMGDDEASEAIGFPMAKVADGTSVSCVYTSGEGDHAGTVLSVTASDAGRDTDQLLAAAESASTGFSPIEDLGDGAYVATVRGLPQGAVIVDGRQYSVALSATPPLPEAEGRTAVTKLLRAIHAGLGR